MPEGNDTPIWQNLNSLQLIMDHPRVWEAVRNEVFERTAIREKNEITLSLVEIPGLLNSQMALCIDYNYELRSLRSGYVDFEIRHYLDDHIECAQTKLPEFERVEIGATKYSGRQLKEKIKDGVFSMSLALQPSDRGCVPVRTKRWEVTYVPGVYNLVMNELCAGVSIRLDKLPPGIVAYVREPHASKPVLLQAGATLNDFKEKIVLPGQGFEFRFTPEVATASTLPLFARPPKVEGYFLEIQSPTAGENVQDGGYIKGTAHLPPDWRLWVFVGGAASFGRWRPQGNGAVEVKVNLKWEVPALYGRAADTGSFEILAIVVDDRAHDHLLISRARAEIAGKPIDLPSPIENYLVKTIAVRKSAIQLDQFTLERKGSVGKHDRRVSGDRRNRQAG